MTFEKTFLQNKILFIVSIKQYLETGFSSSNYALEVCLIMLLISHLMPVKYSFYKRNCPWQGNL